MRGAPLADEPVSQPPQERVRWDAHARWRLTTLLRANILHLVNQFPDMTKKRGISSQLRAINVARPADLIIRQIRNLIADGVLCAGDRLPAERELAATFGVGRGYVREALRTLEFYGVLQTFPQSGTVVASLGGAALQRLISNVLALDRDDIEALTETRVVLEMSAAQLAAQRASPAAVASIRAALDAFRDKVALGEHGVEEDHLFHLAIANATRNPIMASVIGLITPDIIRINKNASVCEGNRASAAVSEHEAIFDAIAAPDVEAAVRAMSEHMRMTRRQYERLNAAGPPARVSKRGATA